MSSTIIPKSGRQERRMLVPASATLRWLDIVGALIALILLAPLFVVAILLILYEDGRPIFFCQTRVGQNGEPFLILKFRTMRRETGGRAITVAGDTRVTRAGAWLRKRKLDELPQLINVVRGEMSLIGPRPEVPEYIESHDDLRRVVMQMRPGITDLASLMFRNEEEMLAEVVDPETHYRSSLLPAKLLWNIRYQESRSLLRDFKLLWLTAWYSFFPAKFDRERILRAFGMQGVSSRTPGAGLPCGARFVKRTNR
jgi:lipopolysaccharide/colanic/teichoic acid biosynthesis glycosyltransferase